MEIDLNACCAGSKEEWDRLVDRYAGVVVAAVRRVLGSGGRTGLEDVVQDVFVRLVKDDYRLLRGFDPSRAAFTTWITIVARSTAIDHLRRSRREPLPVAAVESAEALEPATIEGPAIPRHILSERQQIILHLLYDRGMSVVQAASLLNVAEQTVRSMHHKALVRLRGHFEAEGDEEEGAESPPPRAANPRGCRPATTRTTGDDDP